MGTIDVIRSRRSVRTFNALPLRPEDAKQILDFAEKVENPYDIPIIWKLLDAKKHELNSPVIVGTDLYITGKMHRVPHAEEAFGYAFEKVVLFALSLGIGTTWIAGTMNRDAFERAMEVSGDEVMPCVSPLGYPAEKMSLRETMMRKGIKADIRKDFSELFFDRSFDTPLSESVACREALEMVRWAPSAVNRQPWRVVIDGNRVHFYEKRSKGYVDATGWDLQKVDVGIALCHFDYGMEGKTRLALEDPGLNLPEETFYVATLIVE